MSDTRASVNVLSGRWTCHSLDRTCPDLSCPAASITIATHTAPDIMSFSALIKHRPRCKQNAKNVLKNHGLNLE